jgi:hypothetical protein
MLHARTIGVATELGFDAAYLLTLWALVLGLRRRLVPLQGAQCHCARPCVLAFSLLAVGDSAHVGLLPRLLLALALLRMLLLALPQSQWTAVVAPQPWSLLRNLPLVALTVGVGVLCLGGQGDPLRRQRWIGILLLLSALCHLPVALWIQEQPLLGLLMIRKSLCYLAMGPVVYRRLPSRYSAPGRPSSPGGSRAPARRPGRSPPAGSASAAGAAASNETSEESARDPRLPSHRSGREASAAAVAAAPCCIAIEACHQAVHAMGFAGDPQALALSLKAVELGWLETEPEQARRQFRLMSLFERCSDPRSADFARRHRDGIHRFGRFPHRNAALGRVSSD